MVKGDFHILNKKIQWRVFQISFDELKKLTSLID